jgi:hypothetical protein
LVQVQVTVPPTATVSTAGFDVLFRLLVKLKFSTFTPIALGGGGGGGPPVAVAEKVIGEPVAPWTAAWALWAPLVGPSVQVLAAVPDWSVVPEVGERLPSVVDHATATDPTGFPSRVTTIRRASGSAWDAGPVC